MSQRNIGFVDYRLDNFHAEVYLSALRGPLAERGFHLAGATALLPEPSQAWANEKQLPYYPSAEALAEQVDYFIVLAPSNPELHLEICQAVLPLGKPTFVDKTFAPDLETSVAIFELADACEIPIQSTSALRTSSIQKHLESLSSPLECMFITASGPTFEEYGIHPVEIAVSCMGAELEGLMRLGSQEHPRFVLNFSKQRNVMIDFNQISDVPYSATLVTSESCQYVAVDTESLFVDAVASILDFFDQGESLIDRRETLVVRHILDLAMQDDLAGRFVDLTSVHQGIHTLPAPHWKSIKATQL